MANQFGKQLLVGQALSATLGESDGPSISEVDYLDMNGDRFSDVVSGSGIQYTTPRGGLAERISTAALGLDASQVGVRESNNVAATFGVGGSVPLTKSNDRGGAQASGTRPAKDGASSSMNASLGFNLAGSQSASEAKYDLLDVNGDGLLDRVTQVGSALKVRLNYGYRFGADETWDLDTTLSASNGRELSAGVTLGINDGIFGFGGGVTVNLGESRTKDYGGPEIFGSQVPGATLVDVNGDGLIDRVLPTTTTNQLAVSFNLGSGFGPPVAWLGAPGGDLTESEHLGAGGGAYFTVGVGPLCLAGCYLIVNAGVDHTESVHRQAVALSDINGDGYPDHLTSTADNEIQVRLNQHERTNLLVRVNQPLGGRFDLAYDRAGNTFDLPQSRWVLAEVTSFDGVLGDSPNGGLGADFQKSTFAYEDGRYDRLEREFYGFGRMIMETLDTRGLGEANLALAAPYQRVTRTYDTSSWFSKGLLQSEQFDGLESGSPAALGERVQVFALRDIETGNIPTAADDIRLTNSAVFSELQTAIKRTFEGDLGAWLETSTTFSYDAFGNVVLLSDSGDASDPDDDFTAEMSYTGSPGGAHAACAAQYLIGFADSIQVTDGSGVVLRQRDAEFSCLSGDLLGLEQISDSSGPSVQSFSYTADGNLAHAEGPENQLTQRYALDFTYDPTVRTHVTEIGDSFGHSSFAIHDLRFGLTTASTDTNGQQISTELDDYGRVVSITGPYQQPGGVTIQHEYHPTAIIPYAVTRHNDEERSPVDTVDTIVFIDAHRRVLQTKKNASLHSGPSGAPVDAMIVSGRVSYDHLGRVVEQYFPLSEPKDPAPNETFNGQFDSEPPTLVLFDVKSRAVRTTIPDGTFSTAEFAIVPDPFGVLRQRTNTSDAEGVVKFQYSDVRQRLRLLEEPIAPSADVILTQYHYNAVDELVRILDDQGNETLISYDKLGRRTAIASPDSGETTLFYDPASNVIEKRTQNLAAISQSIVYSYDHNRLTAITYPESTDNDVSYLYGSATLLGNGLNQVGRVISVTDQSGTATTSYGPLGEVVQEVREINSDSPAGSSATYTTSYQHDTWGRLRQLTFPDGEILTYQYDAGGMVRQASGSKLGVAFPYLTRLEYDRFGQRRFQQLGNAAQTSYAYDPKDRRLAELDTQSPLGGAFQKYRYQYDDVGNVLSLQNQVPVAPNNSMGGPIGQSYTYDGLHRLTTAAGTFETSNKLSAYTLSVSYDSLHNVTRKTQAHTVKTGNGQPKIQQKTSYDFQYFYAGVKPHAVSLIQSPPGSPLGVFARAYGYDGNGNQTDWQDLGSSQSRAITWDEENRIQAIADNGQTTTFRYDHTGTRTLKRGAQGETAYVNPYWTVRNKTVATKHIYIGSQRLTGKVVHGASNLVPQPTPSPPQSSLTESGKQFWYHPDHLGSTSFITDKDGKLFEHNQYFPYGESWVSQKSQTELTPYLFTGKELDQETGLYYFGARYYDPRANVRQSADAAMGSFVSSAAAWRHAPSRTRVVRS